MTSILIESQYMPPVAYFSAIAKAEKVCLESYEHFEKQSYRNRCRILTSTKVLDLSVPVHHQGKKIPIQKVMIDYQQKWQSHHWRSIETAYKNSPFFDFYSGKIKAVIFSNISTLFELNCQLLTLCLEYLQIDTPIVKTDTYKKQYEDVTDLRSAIHPKKGEPMSWFVPKEYIQTFGNNFVVNLSVLDLLFNEGPSAATVVNESFR